LYSIFLLIALLLAACSARPDPATRPAAENPTVASPITVPANADVTVTITGGYETDPHDKGRPVILIAAALGVPADVFREAFSHVKPAGAGQEPDPEQVRLNKKALLDALGPYGVTNERLDEVSNYYRYSGSAGETWPRIPATATAIVENGVVTGFVITNPGSGYSSVPIVTVTSAGNVTAVATVSYTTDFNTNGSVTAITLTGNP
jgi:hypothetical protein